MQKDDLALALAVYEVCLEQLRVICIRLGNCLDQLFVTGWHN